MDDGHIYKQTYPQSCALNLWTLMHNAVCMSIHKLANEVFLPFIRSSQKVSYPKSVKSN